MPGGDFPLQTMSLGAEAQISPCSHLLHLGQQQLAFSKNQEIELKKIIKGRSLLGLQNTMLVIVV